MAVITGTSGNDTLPGTSAANTIHGLEGNDLITGGAGNDTLYGGAGDDIFDVSGNDFGIDRIYGGDGTDYIRLRSNIQVSDLRWNDTYLDSVEQLAFNGYSISGTTGNDSIDISGFTSMRSSYNPIRLGDGNDVFHGYIGNDSVMGESGSDTLYGGAGNDTLEGGSGDDHLYGGTGNDIFNISGNDFGHDRFYGGDGTDAVRLRSNIQVSDLRWNSTYLDSVEQLNFSGYTISGTAGNDSIDISGFTTISSSYNTVRLGDGADTFIGYRGNDHVMGESGNDTLYGEAGNDTLDGGSGDDHLYGGTGNDVFDISGNDFGHDHFYGGDGTDTVRLRSNVQVSALRWNDAHLDSVEQLNFNGYAISGTTGNDSIDISGFTTVSSSYRTFDLGDGNDIFIGYRGDDHVLGGSGNDSLYGGAGNDTLVGGSGNDLLDGGSGNDIFEVSGNDFGHDSINGGDGIDTIRLRSNVQVSDLRWNDTYLQSVEQLNFYGYRISGTSGNDRIDLSGIGAVSGSYYAISLGDGNDVFIGLGGNDIANGDSGNDTLYGGDGHDNLSGGDGNDTLYGGNGSDSLYGGDGNDALYGGTGNDRLYGGAGDDWIEVGSGASTIDGGTGRDMLSFNSLGATGTAGYRIDVDLGRGRATSGDDTYIISNIERVTGTDGADRMRGTSGNDHFRGMGDYDWFTATAGNDTYDGGTGADMVSYIEWEGSAQDRSFSPLDTNGRAPSGSTVAGVIVDLANPANNTNLAAGDSYISVERITGSSWSDVFWGNDQENDFRGGAGDDWFVSSTGGRERYYGGAGTDTVTYFNAREGVIAHLSNGAPDQGRETGYGSGGDARQDLYFEIENLVGSNFNDVLTGNSDRNILMGLDGDDLIYGGAGSDTLKGGMGDDTLYGGSGSDTAIYDFNRSDYTITKGRGNVVTISGPEGNDILHEVEYFQFKDQMIDIWSL